MEALFFWVFAVALVLFGVAVIANRNPVASALSLVAAFICLAALFLTLEAFFLAAAQVIIYAGAVMVLFLFIVMLLDVKAGKKKPLPWIQITLGLSIGFLFASFFQRVLFSNPHGHVVLKWREGVGENNAREIGTLLFSQYGLPFLVVGVLLLLATVGVVILSKREDSV